MAPDLGSPVEAVPFATRDNFFSRQNGYLSPQSISSNIFTLLDNQHISNIVTIKRLGQPNRLIVRLTL
jgi:hypothetical protein